MSEKQRFTPKKQETYRQLLLKKKRDIIEYGLGENEIASIDERNSKSELMDCADDTALLELTAEKLDRNYNALKEINFALHKIRQGIYGICEICDKRIPTARLDAMPEAQNCIGCQVVEEKKAASQN